MDQTIGQQQRRSKARLQNSLNQLFPYALGIFEPSENEQTLIAQGVFVGEDAIKQQWLQAISAIIAQTSLQMPTNVQPIYGGRKGYHTEYLQPMLNEMTEVSALDPSAAW
jgi:ring-1,2-phenylacetyl-CoA epoxidase subunit PaaC